VQIEVQRDWASAFEPVIVPKRARRLGGIDDIVISLVARGLTTGEVQATWRRSAARRTNWPCTARSAPRFPGCVGCWVTPIRRSGPRLTCWSGSRKRRSAVVCENLLFHRTNCA